MQKTSFFKRIMTLFLAFIMMLGLLPISQFTAPAYAAEASGGPPATTTIHDANLWTAYQSPILGTVIPRLFTFNMGSGVAPGFCADHSKDFSKSATWENPVPISETKYNFCMPLIAQYNWFWFYSVDVDQRYPGTSVEFKQNIAEQERGSIFYYWSEKDRISYSAILQSTLWLTGADKITTLDDPSVQLMIAAERNRTLTKMQGYCSETDQEVAGWVKEAITKYDRGDYGEWDVYYYTPRGSSSIQPMVVTVPPTTVEEREGWIKIKKTDQSGNALAGATFGVYLDSACQNPVGEFTTTADEWTYYQIPSMTESLPAPMAPSPTLARTAMAWSSEPTISSRSKPLMAIYFPTGLARVLPLTPRLTKSACISSPLSTTPTPRSSSRRSPPVRNSLWPAPSSRS